MSGLVLSLRPYEKILVGGVVLQNGQRRTQIRVLSDGAGVLRLSDALSPDEVKTPLTRAYYAAQSLLLGEGARPQQQERLSDFLSDALTAFCDFRLIGAIKEAVNEAEKENYYKVMRVLRPILPEEAAILHRLGISTRNVNQLATMD